MSASSNIVDDKSNLRDKKPLDDEIKYPIINDYDDDDEDFPTTGIRVLLVDADSNSLLLTQNLMAQYQVTKYEKGEEAMDFLMKNKNEIDLIIWDFDINGLDALITIRKEMDLPVVIMSNDDEKEKVMKSTKNGACEFLVKPVSEQVTAVLWQHVYSKKMSITINNNKKRKRMDKPVGSTDLDEYDINCLLGDTNEEEEEEEEEDSKGTCDHKGVIMSSSSSSKKRRMMWTSELHHKFELAIQKIGSLDKAFPKQILKYMQEEMNVQGLTRNNVASHLQKHRLNSNKKIIKSTPLETREDYALAGADLLSSSSNPLLSSSLNLHAHLRMNDQVGPRASYDQAAPIQYSSNSYMPMNNNNYMMMSNHLSYNDPFQLQQQQQQQQYYPPLSMLTKQESGHVSSTLDNPDPLFFDSTFSSDQDEDYFYLLNN